MVKKICLILTGLGGLAVVIITGFALSEKLRFQAIVIHHSASGTDNYQSIRQYHIRERHWADAAYHLILSNGSTEIPLGWVEATGRYRYLTPATATKSPYYNLRAIHICLVGDYDTEEVPVRLQVALVDLIRQLQAKYWVADDQVLFHRDCSASDCPGRFITKEKVHQWMATEAGNCPAAVHRQHAEVVGPPWKWKGYGQTVAWSARVLHQLPAWLAATEQVGLELSREVVSRMTPGRGHAPEGPGADG